MCGIVGAVANGSITQLLVDGLKRLEYRGYDSAGIAVINQQNELQRIRAQGKVSALERALQEHPLHASIGIAHTRWATHGIPSEKNAHPILSHGEFALVHNGIIENHQDLRNKLIINGYQFESDTDTEVAVHLIHYHYQDNPDLLAAVFQAVREMKGAYAFVVFSIHEPDRTIGVCHGAPLVVGKGIDGNFIASDSLALLTYTQNIIYLENNDIVDLSNQRIVIYDKDRLQVTRKMQSLNMMVESIERGHYQHYMLKEIMEQPKALGDCLQGRIHDGYILKDCFDEKLEKCLPNVEHIQLVACGTSYHAAMVGKYWLEALTDLPCTIEVASEFRYRKIALAKNSLYITLSQSGETADSLAALQLAKAMSYLHRLAITNVAESAMTRTADSHFLTRAGIEIGVASTKAFVTQLMALFLLALTIRKQRNIQTELDKNLIIGCATLPNIINFILQSSAKLHSWTQELTNHEHALFLGRNILYPIALEGALKLKEISYIHAEGYPAGELKHGPLALIDSHMPVIALVAKDEHYEKMFSNLQEVHARGAKLFVFADENLTDAISLPNIHLLSVPSMPALLSPIAYSVPLQLLAYQVAVQKGTDVDQPRNLAKSVTVE